MMFIGDMYEKVKTKDWDNRKRPKGPPCGYQVIMRIGFMCSYVRLDEISNKVFKGKV